MRALNVLFLSKQLPGKIAKNITSPLPPIVKFVYSFTGLRHFMGEYTLKQRIKVSKTKKSKESLIEWSKTSRSYMHGS